MSAKVPLFYKEFDSLSKLSNIKGAGANFSFGQLSSIDIIQPYAKPTNVWLLLISCLYIIVQPLVRI